MPKPQAQPADAQAVVRCLASYGLDHLRARKRGALVILESGPEDDPIPHARLRRDTVHLWTLEVATHTGRWETTGFRDTREKLIALLVTNLPWILAPHE
jgi:hypothetical protein